MPRILNVGQCGFDHSNISRFLHKQLKADVDGAPTAAEAKSALDSRRYDLILVNRVLDGDGTPGVRLIESLRLKGLETPMMLVSNYPDAQAAAVKAGALPGFGKSQLHESAAMERIQAALKPMGEAERPGENTLLEGGQAKGAATGLE